MNKKTTAISLKEKKQTKNKINFPSQEDIDQVKTQLKDLVKNSRDLHPDNEVRKWVENLILVLSNSIKGKSDKVASKLAKDLDDLRNELNTLKKKL
jgi:hypothetical protein